MPKEDSDHRVEEMKNAWDEQAQARIAAAKAKAEAAKAEAEAAAKAAAEAAAKPHVYVVQAGDSLSKIAKQVYGDAGRWKEIFEANRDKIKDPNIIHVGQELVIPKE
jgi:nucleoid-associated protein YgaU